MDTSDSDSSPDVSSSDDGIYEKWLVRILLTLAFGLAFGIEGMTLLRSYLFYGNEPETEQSTEAQRPVLQEGSALVPSIAPGIRVRRLRVRATDEAWTFVLTARPDTALDRSTILRFDRLTMTNGTALIPAPSHTWTPPDTASFTASWALPVGQRPDALTITATAKVSPDSTVSATRTMDVGHVPVRMQ